MCKRVDMCVWVFACMQTNVCTCVCTCVWRTGADIWCLGFSPLPLPTVPLWTELAWSVSGSAMTSWLEIKTSLFMLAWQAFYLMSHFPSPWELMTYSKSLPGSSLLEMEKSLWSYQPSITLRMFSLLLSLFRARDGARALDTVGSAIAWVSSPALAHRTDLVFQVP